MTYKIRKKWRSQLGNPSPSSSWSSKWPGAALLLSSATELLLACTQAGAYLRWSSLTSTTCLHGGSVACPGVPRQAPLSGRGSAALQICHAAAPVTAQQEAPPRLPSACPGGCCRSSMSSATTRWSRARTKRRD